MSETIVPGLGRRERWVLTALVVVFSLWLLRSFLLPIAWAFVIALASWPLYVTFAARLPRWFGSNAAALSFTALVTLFVVGPFGFALVAIGSEAQSWAQQLVVVESRGLAAPAWLTAIPVAGSWLADQWNATLATPGGVSQSLKRFPWLLDWAGSAGGLILRHTMITVFTILGLFFLYRGGEPLAVRVRQFIHDKLGLRGDAYFREATAAIRATMAAMIIVALIDGALCGLAYGIAGVPSAHVWGAITGLLATIPFLGYFAVAGAALALLAHGAGAAATLVLLWGFSVVFVADKFVRTALIGRSIRLGFFWILVGSLAGLESFGLLGLFIGPAILALTAAVLRDAVGENGSPLREHQ